VEKRSKALEKLEVFRQKRTCLNYYHRQAIRLNFTGLNAKPAEQYLRKDIIPEYFGSA